MGEKNYIEVGIYMSDQLHMTDKEQAEFESAKKVFETLLEDFNTRGLLQKGIPRERRERLAKMWRQSRQFALAFNTTFNIFETAERVKSFTERNRVDGIDAQVLTGSFTNQAIGIFLYDIETVFKTSLLFFLKEAHGLTKRMEVGKLLNTIKQISPDIESKLEPLIDLELRNALAHGAVWFEAGGNVYLAPNSYLENIKSLKLHDFYIRIKKQNIVAHAFIEVLLEKAKQGYFKQI